MANDIELEDASITRPAYQARVKESPRLPGDLAEANHLVIAG